MVGTGPDRLGERQGASVFPQDAKNATGADDSSGGPAMTDGLDSYRDDKPPQPCDHCRRLQSALDEMHADRNRLDSALRLLIHACEGSRPSIKVLHGARDHAIAQLPDWNSVERFREGFDNLFTEEALRSISNEAKKKARKGVK
jgi:hypothetical protein